ncbi:NAD-dependent epimerase/dehydratase family protein [Arthrobacter sp. Br18]|uniref:NAD-dependent epimerase/dehydratase family protein n=1 Tax=Arthrobacter sp. Br18 TaxID=1312954 RepID=UPI00047AA9B0|nr:NAD-dependent epimerase/dehydratase family protein [Arthrobacter sp. Br18]
MKVLVTGASGMLGGAVAALLVEAGYSVRTLQRRPSGISGVTDHAGSLTDRMALGSAVATMDAVIHLAAKVSFTGSRAEFDAVNVDGTRNLLEAARRAGVRDIVYVSSPSVAHAGRPMIGSGATTADPGTARGEYARSKASAELLALGMSSSAFRVAAVRPHVVWGPGDTQLVERVIARARVHRLPVIAGGTALIDSTYVDNAASAIVACLRRIDVVQGSAVVVTNGEPRPVGELVAGICRAGGVAPPRWGISGALARTAGSLVERIWTATGAVDEPPMTRFLAEQLSTAHWFDQRETRALLDWEPAVSIDQGLQRLTEYYRP